MTERDYAGIWPASARPAPTPRPRALSAPRGTAPFTVAATDSVGLSADAALAITVHPPVPPPPGPGPVPPGCPGYAPIPAGRGRWRITLHHRQFDNTSTTADTLIAELTTARSRRLERKLNTAATLTFTIDGRDPAALLIAELTTDVVAWRWDDQWGHDVAVFRGIVCQSQDTITEQANSVNFTAKDYLAMLDRRNQTIDSFVLTQVDQDDIVRYFVEGPLASSPTGWAPNTSFAPADFLPLWVWAVYGDGTLRPNSGQLRDRTYLGGQKYGDALTNLGNVIGGFDFDVEPGAVSGDPMDHLRIFYPYQGVLRDHPGLVYGSSVAAVTRSFNSANYANYVRVIGAKPQSDDGSGNVSTNQDAPNMFAERWYNDAGAAGLGPPAAIPPVGLWMDTDTASDVSIQATLDAAAGGYLARNGIVVPSYSLTLTPDTYAWGRFEMGDEVPLTIQAGRLNVDTYTRITSLNYAIGDDGSESVEVEVGRPVITINDLFTKNDPTIAALVRR